MFRGFTTLSAIIALSAFVGCRPPPAESQVRPDSSAADTSPVPKPSSADGPQGSQAGIEAYPNPNLLVEPAGLAKAEVARPFVVLDARDRKAFDAERLPHARWVDAAAWAKAFGTGNDAQGWSEKVGRLGIDQDSRVVVYDARLSKDAARIWWILRYWGVADVRLLNGGWAGWKAAGLPVEGDQPRPIAAKTFDAVAIAKRLATKRNSSVPSNRTACR